MGKIAKEQRRAARRWIRNWRQSIMDATPEPVRRALGPVVNTLDMLLVDHGIFRLVYVNRHRLGPSAWRSGQPTPFHIRAWAAEGVRTVVNLRGPRFCGGYWLEQQACIRRGVTLVDYHIRSRAAPTREEILGAKRLLARVHYPIVLHCKAGADRAGLMSVLYRHFREGEPIAQARRELSARFGHFRIADTGILDHFFDTYLAFNASQPITFEAWVEQHYDPEELKLSFKSSRWASFVTRHILRRE